MRTAWFWLISTIATILVAIRLLLVAMFRPRGRAAQRASERWGKRILWAAGVRMTVRGREHAEQGGPFLVVPNHASMLDIAAGFTTLGLDIRYASRPFFFKVPFLGLAMKSAGHLSIDPKKPRAAARVLRDLDRLFERGRSIVLFAEGTRSKDGTIQTYRRGPFQAAIQHGVPVLPVRFKGLYDALPSGAKSPSPGVAEAIIGPPIPTADLGPPDAKRLAREVEAWARNA